MSPRRFAPTPLALAIALLAAPGVQGASKSWICSVNYWDSEGCWSPFGLPGPADNAFVGVVGGVNTVLRYDELTDYQVVKLLQVNAPRSGPTVTVEQSDGSLNAATVRLGATGRGAYVQTGGKLSVTGSLILADLSDFGSGSYLLKGGQLQTGITEVSKVGTGSFEQSGGSHLTGMLDMDSLNKPASYRLSGGSLQVTDVAKIGRGSIFEHLGGTASVKQLDVGTNLYGTFVILGNSSLQATTVRVGVMAQGLMQQEAGSGIVTGELLVGLSSGVGGPVSSFEQYGGSLASTRTVVGDTSRARLYQSGGEHATQDLVIGRQAGSNGLVDLTGGLLSSGTAEVGRQGSALLWQTGGTHRVGSALTIGSGATYRLAASGLLDVVGQAVAVNHGSFEHQGGRFQGTLDNRGSFVYGVAGSAAPDFAGRLVNHGSVVLAMDARFGNGLRNEAELDILPAGRTLTLDGQGLENNGFITLRGGTLTGNSQLANHNSLSGLGRIAGDQFHNHGSLVQAGGTLALASTGGAFNHGRWEMQAGHDLKLDGSRTIFSNLGSVALQGGRVTGTGQLVNRGAIRGSGQIYSEFHNSGTLGILHGEQVSVAGGFINAGLIDLRGSSALLVVASGQILNPGLVAGNGRILARIDNQASGRIQAEGGVLSFGDAVGNAGLMVAEAGGTLLLQRPLASQTGTLRLNGGTIDMAAWALRNDGTVSGHGWLRAPAINNAGQMQFSAGSSQIDGMVDNLAGGRIIVSGTGVATFYGNVFARTGSELRVAADSAAVFFGAVSQAGGAAFTGDGTRYFEGGLSVGDSPGSGGSQGSVVLGSANLYSAEIGGLAPGSGFDHFMVADQLRFGGTLQLSWWGGFEAQSGQRFDLFDWGSTSGVFGAIDLAAAPLDPGLRWDTSRLYLDGSVGVTAVPEPRAWALMLAGLAWVGGMACRRSPCQPHPLEG